MYHVFNAFISCSISIIGVILFGRIILGEKIKISNIKLVLLFLVSCVIYTFDFLYLDNTFKTIIMLLINTVIYKYCFNVNLKRSMFLAMLHILILVIPDTFVLLFVTKVLNMDKSICYDIFAGGFLCNLFVFIIYILITYLLRKPLRKLINYKLENNIKIIIFSILTFLSVIMIFYSLINQYSFSDNIIVYIFSMIVSSIILFILIKQTYDNNVLNQKYDRILGFMTTYEEEVEKQRILRHETKNEFLNIKGQLIDKEKKENIIKYIDSILNDKNRVKHEEYAKFQYLPPNGIKGLCYLKVQEAQNKGIVVGINISPRIVKSNIYNLTIKERKDFARILGVYLDNAIEASMESKEKQIGIEAYIKNEQFQMIISNTYNGEIDINRIGNERFSTKGKNRGHGLLLVKNIIKMNNIFEIKTDINNKLYIQYITIKKSI